MIQWKATWPVAKADTITRAVKRTSLVWPEVLSKVDIDALYFVGPGKSKKDEIKMSR